MAWTAEELELIESIDKNVREIHQAHFNRRVWNISDNIITIYDSDRITPLYVFDTNSDLSDITPQMSNNRTTSLGDVRITSTGDARVTA